MRIIVPFTDLAEATEEALKEYEVEYVDVSENEESYFWLLHKLWHECESFIVVEHDHVPFPGALTKLAECERELCGYQVPISHVDGYGIMYHTGPVKYSKSLMERYPDYLDYAPDEQRHWTNAAEFTLNRFGTIMHVHEPPVGHANPVRMSMEWSEYVAYRKTNPLQPHKGRKPNEERSSQES